MGILKGVERRVVAQSSGDATDRPLSERHSNTEVDAKLLNLVLLPGRIMPWVLTARSTNHDLIPWKLKEKTSMAKRRFFGHSCLL